MLEINSVSKSFKVKKKKGKSQPDAIDPREEGNTFHALKNVSFSTKRGTITGLLGANGAGKTTLMRILGTSFKPTSGTVTIDGLDIVEDSMEIRKKIGFLSGTSGLYGRLSAKEIVSYFGRLYGIPANEIGDRVDQLFEDLDITKFAHRQVENLSAGMKQRISIARSLIHSADLIIFDEPTTGLDVPSAQGILNHIEICRDLNKSIIFSTHHMHEIDKLCDQIIIIQFGVVIFQGTVEAMRQASGHKHLDDAYLALTGQALKMDYGINSVKNDVSLALSQQSDNTNA
ncbi:MAG: ABC transporter ATP-binding protein [Pseudomonadota bacterium]